MKISGKKINHWYKNFLSEFTKENISKFDTKDPSEKEIVYVKEIIIDIEKTLETNRGKPKEEYKTIHKAKYKKVSQKKRIRVPILKVENFGKRMCIDDKNLGDHGFTIISNLDTGKIAAMIETRKASVIGDVLRKHVPQKILNEVKILTKDLARNYEVVKKENFWYALSVADKFHVIKLGLQAISDLRVKYRQEELTKRREEREIHICNEARNRQAALDKGERYKTKKLPSLKKFYNGETILEILAGTTKSLSQIKNKWGKNMKKRIKILFEEFPEIKKIYEFISKFREIYDAKEFGEQAYNKAKDRINNWLKKVGGSEISELQNFASTVKYNFYQILGYFKTGDTNAYAESLNAKLQRFLRENFGVKNLDFFLWRIGRIFS